MAKSLLIFGFSQSMLPASVAADAQVSSADGTRELATEELALIAGGSDWGGFLDNLAADIGVGGAVGGVIGFAVGGPPGAAAGAALGSEIGWDLGFASGLRNTPPSVHHK